MVKKWYIQIPELTGTEQRRAYIYLPESYQRDQNKRFPVLYMFDGHNIFFNEDATYGKSWGMKEYMDYTKRQLIIVAVECNHSPDHGRLREYSPFNFDDPKYGKIPGLGKITMDWMVNTFKPYIDSHYRTLPGRETTFIGGSSMGGLMSLYAVLAYNHVFSGAAALSPSIWVNTQMLDRLVRDAKLDPNTVIYMNYGENELSFHAVMKNQFKKVTGMLLDKEVLLNSHIVPNGDHCEACWEKQIPFFMDTLLYSIEKA